MDDDLGTLSRAAAGGDEAAWAKLVERFSNLVWSVLRAHGLGGSDAGDAFQTTWLRLVEHIGRINDPERLGAWLATTARRESIRVARTGRRTVPTGDFDVLETTGAEEPTPEALWLEAERGAELWRAVHALGPRCWRLLRVLMSSPAPSYREVAAALGMPIGSIGPIRRRCLERLRRRLLRDGSISGGGLAFP